MAMNGNRNGWLLALLTIGIVLFFGYRYLNRGYGEVTPHTYELSKALYSACQRENDKHLNKVADVLASDESKSLPANERRWLETIISQARDDDWKSAAKQARRMMEDQVQYNGTRADHQAHGHD